MRLECVTRTHVGCRRKINEDALLARPDIGLWAVADGMGGHMAGEVASALVVAALEGIGVTALASRIAAARVALDKANGRLQGMAFPGGQTIGSTIVLLAAQDSAFQCLWAGDSRAYLLRDGALRQLTHDHSLVQQLVDSGALDAAAAAEHPNANIITRAVGVSPGLAIDQTQGEVRAGDVFLLASDGLTHLVSDRELCTELSAPDLDSAADRLLAKCLDRQAPDNVTFVILKACPE